MSSMNFLARRCLFSGTIAILGLSLGAIATGASTSSAQFPRQNSESAVPIPSNPLSFDQPIDTVESAPLTSIARGASLASSSLGPPANAVQNQPDSRTEVAINATVGARSLPTQIAQQPAGSRYVEVREIKGTVTYGTSGQSVQVGQRLSASQQEFSTGPNSKAFLAIDSLIGTLELSENTTIRVKTLSSGKTSFYAIRGRVRASIGNPYPLSSSQKQLGVEGQKSLLAQDSSSSGNYPVDIETPAGIAGVQGTSFGIDVGPDGKTAISTVDGSVAAMAQGKTVLVNRGQYVVIGPGLAPTQPQPNPSAAQFQILSAKRVGSSAARVVGRAAPLDLVYINDRPIKTDLEGKFSTVVQVPVNRRLKFVVRGPATTETFYEIALL